MLLSWLLTKRGHLYLHAEAEYYLTYKNLSAGLPRP